MIKIECEYKCPHCNQRWVMGPDGIFTDDVEDECTTTCDECGGVFQLRCVSVEVEMEAIKSERTNKLVPVASPRCGEIFPNRSLDAPTDFDGCILPSGHDGGHEFVGSDLLLYGWVITHKLIR